MKGLTDFFMGHSGNGKTHMAEEFAKRMPFSFDISGSMDAASEASRKETIDKLYKLLEQSKITDKQNSKTVDFKQEAKFIFTSNNLPKGGTDYVDAIQKVLKDKLGDSLLDRISKPVHFKPFSSDGADPRQTSDDGIVPPSPAYSFNTALPESTAISGFKIKLPTGRSLGLACAF